jgi:NAD(P)H-nitrite reductase large subunit/nitrogen regulatory protein PII
MREKARLVVIGNGMAGGRFVEELTERKGQEQFDIVVFGEEPHGNYNRILLSSVVAGSHEVKNILLNSLDWYRENNIALHAGVRVEAIDRNKKVILAANGIEERYDRLVFATGSRPFVPPIQGLNKETDRFQEGIFVFRTLDDAFQIMKHAEQARKAVVLGGGLLGLEAARGLLNRGLEVHVVELMPHPMAVQLDSSAGAVLRSSLEGLGIHFHLGKSITNVTGNGKIESVTLNDGGTESCDMLVISAGIRPNIEIAKQAGLAVERGIVVGDDLACINDSSVYAIGECAQHRGLTYGLVAPGSEQARVLADRLSGANPQSSYAGSNTSTALKVMGVDLVVLGEKEPADDKDEVLTYADTRRGIYKKAILRDGRLAGAILLGDAAVAPKLLRAFHKKESVSENPGEILFPALPAKPAGDTDPSDAIDVWEGTPLKEVIAIIRPERWVATKQKVESLGIVAFTHHRVVGRGRQGGLHFLARRGAASGTGFRYLPKRMISWIVPETQVDSLVQTIMETNRTGQIGDGKIFVLPLDAVMQMDTDASNIKALEALEV